MSRVAVAALAMVAALGARAEAATFTLQDLVYDTTAQELGASLQPPISLTVSDAAVARGGFALTASAGTASGDTADFGNLTDGTLSIMTGVIPGGVNLSVTLAFDALGQIASGALNLTSNYNDLFFRGSSASFGGFFIPSGDTRCGGGFDCGVTGTFAAAAAPAIPEPASMALLGLPVLALIQKRRAA